MRKQTKKWTTKSGKKIRICDMTDSHLMNTIKFLQRLSVQLREQHIDHAEQIVGFVSAEMASYYAEQDWMHAMESVSDDYLPDIYYNMVLDVERRGLKI